MLPSRLVEVWCCLRAVSAVRDVCCCCVFLSWTGCGVVLCIRYEKLNGRRVAVAFPAHRVRHTVPARCHVSWS